MAVRLLYVCSDFGIPPSGTKGASIHLRAITGALADLGHEVLLLSPLEGPNGEHPVRRLLPPGCPPARQNTKTLKHWLKGRQLDAAVARELNSLFYNAWVHEQAAEAVADAPPAAIIERLSLLGHVGLDLANALNVPLIVEVNALLTEESRKFRGLALRDLAESIEKRVLHAADAIMAVSAPLAQKLVKMGIAADKIHVVPNGVDLAKFEAAPTRSQCRAELGLGDEFVVGFCGSLKVWHGVDVLLSGFVQFLQNDPSAKLLIVGTGPIERFLKTLVDKAGLADSVIFTGATDHDKVPTMLRAMDVAVAPFRSMENFYFSPIKLFEYMAAGTCVVASRLGQIKQVVRDGVNGLLCRPDDAHDLSNVLSVARQSPELRERLAREALKTVREHYTWRHAGETTEQIIRKALNGSLGTNGSAKRGALPRVDTAKVTS
jgi:glycosyltransferase involved in cell wall biosynthesis